MCNSCRVLTELCKTHIRKRVGVPELKTINNAFKRFPVILIKTALNIQEPPEKLKFKWKVMHPYHDPPVFGQPAGGAEALQELPELLPAPAETYVFINTELPLIHKRPRPLRVSDICCFNVESGRQLQINHRIFSMFHGGFYICIFLIRKVCYTVNLLTPFALCRWYVNIDHTSTQPSRKSSISISPL